MSDGKPTVACSGQILINKDFTEVRPNVHDRLRTVITQRDALRVVVKLIKEIREIETGERSNLGLGIVITRGELDQAIQALPPGTLEEVE